MTDKAQKKPCIHADENGTWPYQAYQLEQGGMEHSLTKGTNVLRLIECQKT